MKGTWKQAIITFATPIIAVLAVRWLILEPFVIPSGSMIPTLLEHDHIVVKKFSLGLRFPFTEKWLFMWREPHRGEVMVFRYPDNHDVFYIKRLIGLPGDEIKIQDGKVTVNGVNWKLKPNAEHKSEAAKNDLIDSDLIDQSSDFELDDFSYFTETAEGVRSHIVRFIKREIEDEKNGTESAFGELGSDTSIVDIENTQTSDSGVEAEQMDIESNRTREIIKVPEDHYFFMGDNRDQSSDSRVWGFVQKDLLIGPAWMVWLSCDQMLAASPFLCDPSQMRWKRIFKFL